MNNKSQKYQNAFNKAHTQKQTTQGEDENNARNDYSLTDYAKALYENIQNVFAKEILPDGIDFKTALDNTINNLNTKVAESADNIASSINNYTEEDNFPYESRESYASNIISYLSSHYTDRIDLQDGNKLYIYVDSEEDGLELVESIRSVFSDDLIDELDFDYYVITDYSDAENEYNNDNDYCYCECEDECEDISRKNITQDEEEIDLLDFALINIAEDFGGKYNEKAKTVSFPDEETKNEYYLFVAELFENEAVLDLITGDDNGGNETYDETDNEELSKKETLNNVFKSISQKINNNLNGFVYALEKTIKEHEEENEYCCQNEHSNYVCIPERETLIEEILSCIFPGNDSITEYDCMNCDCCETCVHCVNCGKCDTCDNQPTFE